MIELWHGGMRWDGRPEIRPSRKGRYENGPGIYLTTSFSRARDYAKGSKVVTRVQLRDDTRWLEDARLPVTELIAFLDSQYRLKHRKHIIEDLQAAATRESVTDLSVSYLVNLGVNYESWGGRHGVALAAWLTEQGIDASLYRRSSTEQWVVVFNPKIIESHKAVAPASIAATDYELPLITPDKGHTMNPAVIDAVRDLEQLDAAFHRRELSSLEHGRRRETALCAGVTAVAADLGVTLKPIHCIDARGEVSVVAETGKFGQQFADLLNLHCHPRTGILPTAIMSDWDTWCRINHFDAERLVKAYAGNQ